MFSVLDVPGAIGNISGKALPFEKSENRFERKRKMTVDEYHFALKLFPREFPERDEITITDEVSPANGAFYVRPTVGKVVGEGYIRMNMGKLYEDCLKNPEVFAHELTHVWQLEHYSIAWYTKEFLNNHVFCDNAYMTNCSQSRTLGSYNAEQQGVLVARAYKGDPCESSIVKKALGTTTWFLMIGGSGRDVAVNANGEIFLTNSAGKIYKYHGKEWQQLSGSDGLAIAANGDRVILVNTVGKIYEWKNNNWQQLPGSDARDIAIDSNGDAWIVNTKGIIYKQVGGAWKKMPGSDGQRIAAGGGQVWLVNSAGRIYQYNSNSNKWDQMAGSDGKDIAVSNNGQIFLTNKVGKIYKWGTGSWTQLDGSDAAAISANNGKFILLNTKGRIYQRKY